VLTGLTADLLVVIHLAFIGFVVFGGLLALKWRRTLYLHLPAAVWGALIEFQGWLCPLTPLEQRLRTAAGEAGYQGGFVEHYVIPVIYPVDLTRNLQILLGVLVIAVNLGIYGWVIARYRHVKKTYRGLNH
jgi:hypothetical protein